MVVSEESAVVRVRAGRRTYRHRAPKRIMMLTWKRCEIPRAKHRNIHITPVLP